MIRQLSLKDNWEFTGLGTKFLPVKVYLTTGYPQRHKATEYINGRLKSYVYFSWHIFMYFYHRIMTLSLPQVTLMQRLLARDNISPKVLSSSEFVWIGVALLKLVFTTDWFLHIWMACVSEYLSKQLNDVVMFLFTNQVFTSFSDFCSKCFTRNSKCVTSHGRPGKLNLYYWGDSF